MHGARISDVPKFKLMMRAASGNGPYVIMFQFMERGRLFKALMASYRESEFWAEGGSTQRRNIIGWLGTINSSRIDATDKMVTFISDGQPQASW